MCWLAAAIQITVNWWGGFFIGMVAVWHAVTILEAMGVREYEISMWIRVRTMTVILLVCGLGYFGIHQSISQHYGFYRAAFAVPSEKVEPNDILLVDRSRVSHVAPGDIMLVHEFDGYAIAGNETLRMVRPRTLAWVAAVGPASITLDKTGLRIDGQPLAPRLFPPELTNILPVYEVTFNLSHNQYLIMFPLRFRRRNILSEANDTTLWRSLWQELFVCERKDFEAEARAI